MKTFKRLLVGLDGEKSDLTILRHIDGIRNAFDIQKIYFAHIKKDLHLPGNDELLLAEQLAPVDENLERLIKADIDESFEKSIAFDYEIIVREGDPKSEMLKLIDEKTIDLLVLGRKPRPGITYFSRTLANETTCSVIFVPKVGHSKYEKILVPIDFSSNSKDALEKAVNYKKDTSGKTEIIPVHFYHISPGYTKSGKTYKEYADAVRSNILHRFDRMKSFKNVRIILDKKDNIAQKIFDFSLRVGADLIVIGSKGRTKIASLINKSIAAKLIEISFHSPVLIDKRRNTNLDTISAMMLS